MTIKLRHYGIVTLLLISSHIELVSQSVLLGTDSVFTEHFGQKVFHPYAWLQNANSKNTNSWLKEQEEYKSQYFKKSDLKRLNHSYSFSTSNFEKKTNFHATRLVVSGYLPQVLTLSSQLHNYETKVLIDCKNLKRHSFDFPTIEEYWISDQYHTLVAAISHSGSDWLEFLVYDLSTLEVKYSLKGIIKPWLLFHETGFYYEHYDAPQNEIESTRLNQRISFHTFNSLQEDDKLIFQNQDPTSVRTFYSYKPKGSKWLYLFHPFKLKSHWGEAISIVDLENQLMVPKPFVVHNSPIRLTFDLILEDRDTVYFRTDMRSPTFEILKFYTKGVNKFKTFVPEYQEVLTDASYLQDGYFGLEYLNNGIYSGMIVDGNGQSQLRIPTDPGDGIDFYYSRKDDAAYFDIVKFHLRDQVYKLNLRKNKFEFHDGGVVQNLNDIVVEVANIPTENGARIPAYIVYAKNKVKKDRDNTTIIHVYGGYGHIQKPYFSYFNKQIVDNGGVIVFPGVRGSGALGTQWAVEGRGANKQNTIDDIIATARYMIKQKFTSPNKLILEGGSHGGFAVAAAAVQRPELFAGVISDAGALDLIGLTNQTVGHAELNRVEFGDPEDSVTLQSRLALSPVHNLENGKKYPSFLLITGANDTRVPPSNSYRFLATLQEKSSNKLNFLHVTYGGHSVTNSASEILNIMSLKYSFMGLLTGSKFWN